MSCVIPPQNQLVMRKTRSNLLWHLTLHHVVLFLEWLQGVKLWSLQQSLPHNDILVTQTHDLGSDTICLTMSCVITPQNQLMMRNTHSNLLWHSTSYHASLFLEQLQRVKLQSLQQKVMLRFVQMLLMDHPQHFHGGSKFYVHTLPRATLCQSIQFKWGGKSSCSCFDFLVS